MELITNIKTNVLNSSFYAECLMNGISSKKCEDLIKNFAYGILRAFINEYCYGDIQNMEYVKDCKDEVSELIQIYILNYKNMSYFYDLLFCNLAITCEQCNLWIVFKNVIENEYLM